MTAFYLYHNSWKNKWIFKKAHNFFLKKNIPSLFLQIWDSWKSRNSGSLKQKINQEGSENSKEIFPSARERAKGNLRKWVREELRRCEIEWESDEVSLTFDFGEKKLFSIPYLLSSFCALLKCFISRLGTIVLPGRAANKAVDVITNPDNKRCRTINSQLGSYFGNSNTYGCYWWNTTNPFKDFNLPT